jgi:MFS family permease
VLAVTAFGAGIPTPLYAVYEHQFQFSSGVLTLIFGAYVVGVLTTSLLVAPLSDSIGRRPVLYVGMVLSAVSGIVWILANGVPALALARVISGLSVGATTSTATASMAVLEPRGDQHHVARVSVAANFGGVASGVLLSGLLVEYAPDPTVLVFLVLIGASVVGAILTFRTHETVPPVGLGSRLRIHRPRVPSEDRLPFWVAAGTLGSCYSLYGLFAALAPTFLRVDLGIGNRALNAGLVAIMFGMAALIQIALGQVRDRNALLIGLPLVVVAMALLLPAFALDSLLLFVLGATVLGAGVGYGYMGSVTLIDRVTPTAIRGEILATFFLVGYLSLAAPTIGIGVSAELIGLGPASFLFGVALALVALTLYLVLRRTPTPAGGEGRARTVTPMLARE